VLNGVKTSELNHTQFASGPIALQHGAGVIKFRKVEIKPLLEKWGPRPPFFGDE
jgi:hypothetical protein